MAIIKRPYGVPLIPEKITVHLGAPDEPAKNITLLFPDYIKSVASSELFATWPQSAIVANIYAQITFALNRYYNEWYRSRGYDFDITNLPQYDQSYIPQIYVPENISRTVDDIFTSYVIRPDENKPAYTPYCDGVIMQCDGLSKWGSVDLANKGYSAYDILKYYYGESIDLVTDIPVDAHFNPYPLFPLKLGSFGLDVNVIQHELNKISEQYPSIPKIERTDGIFGSQTEAAVKAFQKIFNLLEKGVIDSATWYKIKYIYDSVKGVEQIIESRFKVWMQEGDSDIFVKLIQYYVRVLGCYYYPEIPIIEITGYYGPETKEAVLAIQKKYNIIVDGMVGPQTWGVLDSEYKKILDQIPEGCLKIKTIYPGYLLSRGMGDQNVALIQTYLQKISEFYPAIPRVNVTGIYDELTESVVRAFQKDFLEEVTGYIGSPTWNKIAEIYESLPNYQGGMVSLSELIYS